LQPRFVIGVIALVLCVAGGFMVYGNGVPLVREWRSSDWVRVRAEAINPTTYRYTIGNATFTSKVLAPDHVYETVRDDLADLAEALAERYRTKQPFTVFVDPTAPATAMLTRDMDIGPAMAFGTVGLLFCVLGPFLGYLALTPPDAKPPAPKAKSRAKPKRGGKQTA